MLRFIGAGIAEQLLRNDVSVHYMLRFINKYPKALKKLVEFPYIIC